MLGPRDEDLLAVDDVAASLLHRGGPQSRGLRTGLGLGDAEGLQTRLSLRERGKVLALLFLAAVLQERAHRVHLRVSARRVAARPVYLFEDDGRVGDVESGPAVFARDERREPARLRQCIDELLRVLVLAIDLAPIGVAEVCAELPHGGADLLAIRVAREVHLSPEATAGRGAAPRRASGP